MPGAAQKWVQSMHSGQSGNNQASVTTSSNSNRAPQATASGGATAASHTEVSRGDARLQYPKNGTHSETEIEPTGPDSPFPEYILLCIKQKQRKIRLFPNNIKHKWSDEKTFISIKEIYESERASWWRLNTLSHVEFKKVIPPKFCRAHC